MDQIKKISSTIWHNLSLNIPIRETVQTMDGRISSVDITHFLIYNFRNYPVAALNSLFLSTYKYWKDLSISEWIQIFDGISGKMPEYFMAVIAKEFLGIDPHYKSTRNLELFHVTSIDGVAHSGKPSVFIGDMKGELRKAYSELIIKHGLSIDDLIAVSRRLNAEYIVLPEKKNGFLKFFGRFTISNC
jgi:hypothetical protein